jgi:hypothetical protein
MKLYMAIIHEDSGYTQHFGDEDDYKEWLKQAKLWEEQGYSTANDKYTFLGKVQTPEETLEIVKKHIWKGGRNDY